MARGINKYTVVEAQNTALGQLGAIFEDGTTAFTTLTPSSSDFIGTANGNGDAIDTSNTFPQGMTIFGQWTAVTLASGAVVIYLGKF